MDISHVLLRPVITEKSVRAGDSVARTHVFFVHSDAGKLDIKRAILEFYGREVSSIRISVLPEKVRLIGRGKKMTKRKAKKKAYIRLKGDAPLEVVEVISSQKKNPPQKKKQS